jgi:hypothetical protein
MSKVISGAPENDANAKAKMKPLAVLIGDWTTEATHPAFPDTIVKGSARFEWLNGERFLLLRTETKHPDFPDGISIMGVMEDQTDLSMQYFDSRGVHRVYQVAFDGKALEIWRDVADFAQRVTMTLSADGLTLGGVWQLNENNQGYRDDLAITFRRSR